MYKDLTKYAAKRAGHILLIWEVIFEEEIAHGSGRRSLQQSRPSVSLIPTFRIQDQPTPKACLTSCSRSKSESVRATQTSRMCPALAADFGLFGLCMAIYRGILKRCPLALAGLLRWCWCSDCSSHCLE